ncbi:MAG: MCP four helix bundle domain-containing protein, partial [Magnetococcales bacterium]|nr:MCP four helix bundle domain-containing protein [Magnetococcales bacterium]
MNDMRLGVRLGLGFFLVLLIMGISFGVILVQLKGMAREAIQVRDESVPFALLAERMTGQVNEVQQFLTDASLTADPKAVQEALAVGKEVRAGIDRFLTMFNSENDQEGVRRIHDIQKNFEGFLQIGQKMVQAYLDHDQVAATALMGEFDKGAISLESVLEPLRKSQVDEAQANLASVVRSTEALGHLLWIVILIATAVGVATAVVIIRII